MLPTVFRTHSSHLCCPASQQSCTPSSWAAGNLPECLFEEEADRMPYSAVSVLASSLVWDNRPHSDGDSSVVCTLDPTPALFLFGCSSQDLLDFTGIPPSHLTTVSSSGLHTHPCVRDGDPHFWVASSEWRSKLTGRV